MSYFLHYNVLNTMFTAALNQKSLISSYNTLSEDEIKKRLNAFYEEKSIKDGSWINTNPNNDKDVSKVFQRCVEITKSNNLKYVYTYQLFYALLEHLIIDQLMKVSNIPTKFIIEFLYNKLKTHWRFISSQ